MSKIQPVGGSFSAPSPIRGTAMQFSSSADGKVIAYASGKTAVARFVGDDANPGAGEEALKGFVYKHGATVTCVKLSPKGNLCLSGDENGNVVIWGLLPDKNVKYQREGLLGGPIRDACFDAEQERIVVCADARGTSAIAFNVDGGNTLGEIKGHQRPISSCAFRPARPFRVFTGGQDTQVNLHEGPPFKFSKGHTNGLTNVVTSVRFNPAGALLSATSGANAVQLLDGKTGDAVGEVKTEHKGTVYAAEWAPAPSASEADKAPLKLVTASADKTVQCYGKKEDGSWGKEWAAVMGKDIGQMQMGACFVQGGSKVLSCALDGTLTFLNSGNGAVLGQLRGHSRPIISINEMDGGKGFITADTGGRVVSWAIDGSSGGIVSTGALPDHKVESFLAFTAGPSGCLAFGGGKLFKADAGVKSALSAGSDCAPVMYTARLGDSLVLAASKQVALVLDAATGAEKAKVDLKGLNIGDVACAAADGASGLVAVAGGMSIVVFKFDGSGFEKKAEYKGDASPHRATISSLAFSAGGKFLASGDSGRQVAVFDTDKGESLFPDLMFHNGRINALTFFNEQTLVSGGGEGHVIIWNLAEKTRQIVHEAHIGGVQSVGKVGNFIVTAGFGGNVLVWKA